jgi:ubiquinone/menaquinone biosynthesis C-methylase UbiE
MPKNYQKEIYESQEEYFEKIKKEDTPRIKQIQIYLKRRIKPGINFLDLGCAGGEITKKYAKLTNLYGVDISERFLKIARKNGLKVKLANIEKEIPFKKGFFNAVLCSEVMEHIVDTDKVLCEINRVLEINGDLILTIPNVNSIISYPMMLFFDLPPYLSARYKSPHVRDFTLKTIKMALKNNGFRIESYRGCSFFLPPLGSMGIVGEALGRVFPRFSKVIILHAKKEKNVRYDLKKSFAFNLYG